MNKKVILNEQSYLKDCANIVDFAERLLKGDDDYLESVLSLASLGHNVCDDEFDEDFIIFVAISSETTHMPRKVARGKFSKKWLDECDKELEYIKDKFRDRVRSSCLSLLKRFS